MSPLYRGAPSAGYDVVGEVDKCVPPVADARAGTTNAAGGLVSDIDARGYKSATLYCQAGNIASSGAITSKVQSATASGGSYSDISGASVTDFEDDEDNTIKSVDFDIPVGRPWLQIVHTQSETGTIGSSWLVLNGKMRQNA